MKYIVDVDGTAHEVEIARGDGDRGERVAAIVNGKEVPANLTRHSDGRLYTLEYGRKRVLLWMDPGEGGRGRHVRILWNGRSRELDVEPARLRELRRHLRSHAAGVVERETVQATMPGLIVDVEVEAGQAVKEGDGLLVIDAMKMENEVRSPCDGIVERVAVEAGREVNRGQVLCVIKSGAPGEVSAHG